MPRSYSAALVIALAACRPEAPPAGPAPQAQVAEETSDPDPTPKEGSIASFDGLEVAYDVRGAGEPALVLVHCWTCNRAFWREQIDLLAESHRVVQLDLGGHGASRGEREAWTIEAAARDVEAVVEAVGLESFVLIGHSMGGPVSLVAASRMPGRVEAVVCVDTLHNAELRMPPEQVEPFAKQLEADFAGTMNGFAEAFPQMDRELAQWIAEQAAQTEPAAAVALLRELATFDVGAGLQAAKVPVRCVNAAPGRPQVPETTIEINRKYGDFDAVLLEDVGHFLHLERPKAFNDLLVKTLASLD